MVLVMFCGNISLVVWLRFSVNAHGLLTDTLASCVYLFLMADNTSVLQLRGLFTLVHNTCCVGLS